MIETSSVVRKIKLKKKKVQVWDLKKTGLRVNSTASSTTEPKG